MKIDLNTSLKNNIHENSLTKTMKKYYITESAIIKRIYSVKANSEEEAQDIFTNGLDNGLEVDYQEETIDKIEVVN